MDNLAPMRNCLGVARKAKLARPSQEFWGTREKMSKIRLTEEQRQFWETGNIGNQDFDLGQQGNKAIYFSGTRKRVPPLEGLISRRPITQDSKMQ